MRKSRTIIKSITNVLIIISFDIQNIKFIPSIKKSHFVGTYVCIYFEIITIINTYRRKWKIYKNGRYKFYPNVDTDIYTRQTILPLMYSLFVLEYTQEEIILTSGHEMSQHCKIIYIGATITFCHHYFHLFLIQFKSKYHIGNNTIFVFYLIVYIRRIFYETFIMNQYLSIFHHLIQKC